MGISNNTPKENIFEKHKVTSTLALILCFIIIVLTSTEVMLKEFMGLGRPILYDSSPIYGYRPLPNQKSSRFRGAILKINNIGLRADEDWDDNKDNKILFLGDSVTYGGSYIDNRELFSNIAVKDLKNFKTGNAGVNAWGIENIYGLIVESHFRPAIIYITVVPEGDFYRGLTRMPGLPFYNVGPNYALKELWYYFCYQQNNKRYKEWTSYSNNNEKRFIVEKAVKKLKEMDTVLKKEGYVHLILISPNEIQVSGRTPKDKLVKDLLDQYALRPVYILDKLSQEDLSNRGKIFYDGVHLEKVGHEIWGRIIGAELKKLGIPQK